MLTLEPAGSESVISVEIPLDCIRGSIGGEERLDWKVRERRRQDGNIIEVLDGQRDDAVIGRWSDALQSDGSGQDNPCGSPGANASRPYTSGLDRVLALIGNPMASSAFAQETEAPAPFSEEEFASLLEDLASDNTDIRRDARDALANASVEDVPRLMAALREGLETYRTKLGIVVAVTEMLRYDKSKAGEFDARLTDEDLALLLDLAGDSDRTVRIYATEFLYDLDNPRVAQLAIGRAEDTEDVNARYNWLFVSQGGWKLLPDPEKERLQSSLENARDAAGAENPKTQELIDGFE